MHHYDPFPKISVSGSSEAVSLGFPAICERLRRLIRQKTVITVECYPGVDQEAVLEGLSPAGIFAVLHSDDLAFEPEKMTAYWPRI